MNRRIYRYIKALVLMLLLLEAVSPHHHHTQALCCIAGQCDEAPFSRNCEDTDSGGRVVISQGEKAVCPTWVVIVPLILLLIAWPLLWNDTFRIENIRYFSKWHLLYLPEKLYAFEPIIFRFLRPPPPAIL